MNIEKLQIIFVLLLLVSYSCGKKPEQDIPLPPKTTDIHRVDKDASISMSRFWTSDEAYIIKRFVERREWDAVRTPTGIYYYIYKKNKKGQQAKPGDIVHIAYEIRLLNADTTLCYKSQPDTTEPVLIEMDNVESGLHEALTYLKEGEKAYIILPHYLAHGLAGDLNKIPPLAPVLYDIELKKIKQPQQ